MECMSIRMRHTSGHTKNRRSHHALVGLRVVKDEKGNPRLPHRLDEATGMYNDKQIVVARAKKSKEAKAKGPNTEPKARTHAHEKHDHAHENAEQTRPRGFFGKIMNARPKARSGAGGGGAEERLQ